MKVQCHLMDRPETMQEVKVAADDLDLAADVFADEYVDMDFGSVCFVSVQDPRTLGGSGQKLWRVESLGLGYLTGAVTREEAEKEIAIRKHGPSLPTIIGEMSDEALQETISFLQKQRPKTVFSIDSGVPTTHEEALKLCKTELNRRYGKV